MIISYCVDTMLDLQSAKKAVDPLKRPPHSVEAEQSIIGGLMLG